VNDLFGQSHYEGLTRSAELSDCGRYRYSLRRSWQAGGNGQVVCFLMLNPSTADALTDDPTVRRCMAFCRAWGYSALTVRNLFALRSADPAELLSATDPVGPAGDAHLLAAATADLVVCAWGAKVPFGRDRRALELLAGRRLHCLGLTRAGAPRHPLYVRGDAVPLPYRPESCHAGRDGDCNWAPCPQERDGEPAATGRHCPLDTHDPDLEGR
jgi:hypothetical protein